MKKLSWAVVDQYHPDDRMAAWGLMWKSVVEGEPNDEEEAMRRESSIAKETRSAIKSLKEEDVKNTFFIGKEGEKYVAGVHYRPASNAFQAKKLKVVMFYCSKDYKKGGIGDALLAQLISICMTLFEGKNVVLKINMREEEKGAVGFLKRHGFELKRSAIDKKKDTSTFVKTLDF